MAKIEETAIVIKDIWGKILSTLVVAGILGGISFAFAQSSTNAEIRTTIMSEKDRAHSRDTRIDKVDAKIENVQKGVNEIGKQQVRIETKLDYLIKREHENE